MNAQQINTENSETEFNKLAERFDRWLKTTCEPFERWEYDGANFVVYGAGEPEIYEPGLVRELVGAIN